MEYVEVRFVGSRTVFVDGSDCGPTNKILRVNAGTHAFDLGDPKDYLPAEMVVQVKNTSVLAPLVIQFTARNQA